MDSVPDKYDDMNFARIAVIAVAFLAAGFAFPSPSAAQESVGSITGGGGEIIVTRSGGEEVSAGVGTSVFQHDTVFVGPESEATITFVDNTVLTLGAESALIIDELVYDPNGQNSVASFDLAGGLMGLVSGDIVKTGDMTVTTPVSTIGIRGTVVLVNTFTSVTRQPGGGFTVTAVGTQGEIISLGINPDGTVGAVIVTSGGTQSALTTAGTAVVDGQVSTLDAAAVQAAFGNVATALENATGANFTDELGTVEEEAVQEALEELLELLEEENPNQVPARVNRACDGIAWLTQSLHPVTTLPSGRSAAW